MTRDPDRVVTVLKVDVESSGAKESLVIKIDSVRAGEFTTYMSDPAKRTRFSKDVGQMVEKCEADMKDEMMRKHTVDEKPLLVVSPEAESSMAIMFEHSTCCYEGAVNDLYIAITRVLKHWTDGTLDKGTNAYEIRVKIAKPPKQLIQWRHPSPDSPKRDPHSDHDYSASVFPESSLIDRTSKGDFDPRAVLNLKTNEILSLEPEKFEIFREWLSTSGVRGASELLDVLNVQQELERQRVDLQSKIYIARRSRASMFGFIGTLLFDLMHGESVPLK
jgi:hypothetical protein